MAELVTATRRLAVQELGKWILRDTFDKAINYAIHSSDANYAVGRACAVSRDGTYVLRVRAKAPSAPTPPGYVRVYRPVPTWKKEVTYAYVIVSSSNFDASTFLEILLHHCTEAPYVWGVRFKIGTGYWKYLQSDGTWADGTFTFTAQQTDEAMHYGLVVNPSAGTYTALYIRGQRYDIHTLEPASGVTVIPKANYFSYGLYLETSSEVYLDFDEVGVAVL